MKTRIFTTILTLFAIATAAQAQFGGGNGTERNPYIISTTDHLTELANNVNGGSHYFGTYFRLDADLDYTGKTYTPIGINQNNVFRGNFDGNGHSISGVQLNRTASASSSSGIGLFGYFGDTTLEAVIKNLTLSNSTIKARLAVGGIVGLAVGGTIRNCHVTSDVTIEVVQVFDHGVNQPAGNVGSIVGTGAASYHTQIIGCTSAATLIAPSGSDKIGGIVGSIGSTGGSIENCAYTGTINFGGTEYVGGIVGRIWDSNTATLTNNYTGGNCTLGAVGVAGSTQGTDEGYDITHIYTASINTGQVDEGCIVSVPIMADGTTHYYAAGHTVVLADLCTSGTPAGGGMMWGYRAVIDNSNYVDVLPQNNGTWQFVMPAADVSVGIAGVKDITLTDGNHQYTTTVTLMPAATVAYTGTAHKPTVAVKRYVTNLAEGTDFITDIPADGYTLPGDYTIHIWGIGEYGGLRTATFSITKVAESKSRMMEKLDRGTVAVKTTNGVYLSWRLLGSESLSNQAFDIYRDGIKIHTTGAHDATCYTDTEGTESSRYIVVPKRISIDGKKSVAPWTTNAAFDGNSFAYMDIPFTTPEGGTTPGGENYTYSANDMSVADLDGDGEYEIIVKWDPSNSKDNSQAGYTGNVYIDAYKLDGTRMWRIDLGKNIRAGAHYTQFLVYDFDSDGKAEMMVKTSDGTQDGQGRYIGDKSKDYRDSGGTILKGFEFLTIFNGETGAEMQTVEYKPHRDIQQFSKTGWGDTYGNRSERYLAAVAYLDGKTPSAVFMRGYYTYAYAVAYTWDGENIIEQWYSQNEPDGCRVEYQGGRTVTQTGKTLYGQGAHSVSVADVDNDGYDEIIFGSAVLDNDGTVLMYDGRGHGDAEHVSDFDNDGRQEIFFVHENTSNATVDHAVDIKRYNANTESGTEDIMKQASSKDVGRGVMGNIDDGYAAASGDLSLFWSSSGHDNVFNQTGVAVGDDPGAANFLIYWDGDLGSELVANTTVAKYSVASGTTAFSFDGSTEVLPGVSSSMSFNHASKGCPGLVADILGDWRDELIYRLADGSGMRIFFSTIPTEYRLTTLMHDSQYRCAVAWQNVGYNQPPHTSYYIGSAALAKNGSETLNYLDPQTPFTKVAYYDGSEIPTTLVLLDDDSEADTKNHELIRANLGEKVGEVNVRIEGRTLYKTGHWNTLMLPFSLASFAGTPLEDADVRELVPDECAYANGTLTLKFAAVSAIEANKPYIVRWAASEENIVNPQFANVFLEDGIRVIDLFEGGILFFGTYDTFAVPELELKHYLYMGSDSKLYYPLAPMNINAFCTFFILRDFVAGESSATDNEKEIRNIVLDFGNGETTGIDASLKDNEPQSNDYYYSIDGQRLQGKPTKKGIYIKNGKKVVVK